MPFILDRSSLDDDDESEDNRPKTPLDFECPRCQAQPGEKCGGQGMGQFVVRADTKGREFGSKIVPLEYLIEVNREINKRTNEFFKLRHRLFAENPT